MAIDMAANVSIPATSDKLGKFLITLKNALVSSGLWVVTGSGDGISTFENEGQTAGIGGSYDVFAGTTEAYPNVVAKTNPNSITNTAAWYQLKEIGTTRTLQLWRSANGSASSEHFPSQCCARFCADGVQASGADATTVPPPVSRFFNMTGNMATKSAEYMGYLAFNMSNTSEHTMQVIYETTARAGGVCPFFVLVTNTTLNTNTMGLMYESVVGTFNASEHPYIISWPNRSETNAMWYDCFGLVNNTNYGPFYSSNYSFAFAAGERWTFDRIWNVAGGLTVPGAQFLTTEADNIFRTFECTARTNTKYIGVAEHVLINPANRNYPTTYNLSTTEPYITAGHLLLPWKQNVVPV